MATENVDDRKSHVIPEDESNKHLLNMTCKCLPKLEKGIVIHWGFSINRRRWLLSSPRRRAYEP